MAKKVEIEIGQVWTVRVSGAIVPCKVKDIRNDQFGTSRRKTTVVLENLRTGKEVSRSPAALRRKIAHSAEEVRRNIQDPHRKKIADSQDIFLRNVKDPASSE